LIYATPSPSCRHTHAYTHPYTHRWWKNVPFAFMGEKGPVLNRQWKPFLLRTLPNKMSRVIIVSAGLGLQTNFYTRTFVVLECFVCPVMCVANARCV